MNKKYTFLIFWGLLFCYVPALYPMEQDTFSPHSPHFSKKTKTLKKSDARKLRQYLEKIEPPRLKGCDLRTLRRSDSLEEFVKFFKRGPGDIDEQTRPWKKRKDAWKEERDKLTQSCENFKKKFEMKQSELELIGEEEKKSPKRLKKSRKQLYKSRSSLHPNDAFSSEPKVARLGHGRRRSCGNIIGENGIDWSSFDSKDVTVINLPRKTDLAFSDPNDPERIFIVRSRTDNTRNSDDSSSDDLPDDHNYNRHNRGDDSRRRRESGSVNYDQLFRFREYPVAMLFILSFSRYPKTTLAIVCVAAVIAVWKYKAVLSFLEKAKESAQKAAGFEDDKVDKMIKSSKRVMIGMKKKIKSCIAGWCII